MKNTIYLFIMFFTILISCEEHPSPYSNPTLRIGQNLQYSYNDFELYDSSTHILYFKNSHPEIKNLEQSGFSFYADTILIFKGSFFPGYSSSIPIGPFVYTMPFFYPDYALRFEFIGFGQGQDPRNDYRLMFAFLNHNLLHSGLYGEIKEVERNGSQLKFSFQITNKDRDDLLILDPDKMGLNLFHYFTNGPILYPISQNRFYEINIEHQSPSPYNSWSLSWLTVLKSGESKVIEFNYPIDPLLPSGNYKITFEYPGFHNQISREQLYQSGKRIWLGSIKLMKYLTIQ